MDHLLRYSYSNTRPIFFLNKGLDFTGRTVRCNPVAIHIGPNFCGDLSNNPLGGNIPIQANASLLYPTDQLTAIVSTTTHHSTVAFIGTAKGELKKVREYESLHDVSVFTLIISL